MCYTLESGALRFYTGYNNGVSNQFIDHATSLSLATWYHVSFSFKASDKSYRIRILDASIAQVGTDKTGVFPNSLSANEDAPFVIGAHGDFNGWYDGKLDDVLVYNIFLTTTQTDSLAAQTAGTISIPSIHYYNRQARI